MQHSVKGVNRSTSHEAASLVSMQRKLDSSFEETTVTAKVVRNLWIKRFVCIYLAQKHLDGQYQVHERQETNLFEHIVPGLDKG